MNANRDAEYMARFMDRNGVNERWLDTRDDRTSFVVLELEGRGVIGWEDPERDTCMTSVYGPGKDRRPRYARH